MADSNSRTDTTKADQVSTEIAFKTPLDLARAFKHQAEVSYTLALELSAILDAFNDLPDAPSWVFPLHAMAHRVKDAADLSQIEAYRVYGCLAGGER
jgi:hypothetical protein